MKETKNILGKSREEILSMAAKFADKRLITLNEKHAPSDPVAASVWKALLDNYTKEPKPCIAEEAVAADVVEFSFRLLREPAGLQHDDSQVKERGAGAEIAEVDEVLRPVRSEDNVAVMQIAMDAGDARAEHLASALVLLQPKSFPPPDSS